MSIAHVCMQCGSDLRRIRALREPHYGWPLVTCATCGWRCVRRRHPQVRLFRTLLRVDAALARIVFQLVSAGLFGTVMFAGSIGVGLFVTRHPFDLWTRDDISIIAAQDVVIPLLLGAWLTCGFHHCRRYRVWMVWMALMMLALLAYAFVAPLDQLPREGSINDPPVSLVQYVGSTHWMDRFGRPCALAAGNIVVMMIVAMTGIPLGRWLLSASATFRRWRWRMRRKRIRAGRLVV